MIRVAFATNDHTTVNLHFGGAESLMVYDVAPGRANLFGIGDFVKAEHVGESGRVGLTGTVQDKVLVKLDFLEGCHAVYAASIGTSSIRRLMAAGIQPIIVDTGHDILDLLNEVSLALVYGGLAWVERAKSRGLAAPAAEASDSETSRHLVSSIDELE